MWRRVYGAQDYGIYFFHTSKTQNLMSPDAVSGAAKCAFGRSSTPDPAAGAQCCPRPSCIEWICL